MRQCFLGRLGDAAHARWLVAHARHGEEEKRRGVSYGALVVELRLPSWFSAQMPSSNTSSNGIVRPWMSAYYGQREDRGQREGLDGLGRLAAWVSLSLNPRVLPWPLRARRKERLRVVAVAHGQTIKIPQDPRRLQNQQVASRRLRTSQADSASFGEIGFPQPVCGWKCGCPPPNPP